MKRRNRLATGMLALLSLFVSICTLDAQQPAPGVRRLLYVATPGIRDYLEYGGHGLLVFDMDDNYRFVRRIPLAGLNEAGKPMNLKGVCASEETDRIYVSTLQTLQCVDLKSDKLLWERAYEGGCDRMAISPDGKTIYLPSLEKDHWHVVDALTGDILVKLVPKSGAHNTIYGLDGKHAYLAGLRSPLLAETETEKHTIVKQVGPFSAPVRPFTINGEQTFCFVNVNELLGFEVGDLTTGEKLHRVEVQGFQKGPIKRHGCPSHGIGLTPDEKEIWVCDAANQMLHIFDGAVMPPKQIGGVKLRDEPGWITFRLDGVHAWPSTGEVIDVATRKVVTQLTDETGAAVQSEKMVEVHFRGRDAVQTGDQFGLGRKPTQRSGD
jgi:DNA-binding beta-propeller fold protein YncE